MEIKKTFKVGNLLEEGMWGAGIGSAVCLGRGDHRGALIAAGIGFVLDGAGVGLERRKARILDQCLDRLKAGEKIGSIMANHEGDEELGGCLKTARLVLEAGQAVPSAERFWAGRGKLLEAVGRKRREKGLDLLETKAA